jgi:hypothetical protein
MWRRIVFLRSVLWLLVTANFVPRPPILFTLMMEAIYYSEMPVLTRATQRNIPEDGILILTHIYSDSDTYKITTFIEQNPPWEANSLSLDQIFWIQTYPAETR